MLPNELVFIIDLNEVEGDETTISMDFTVQFGARVWPHNYPPPGVGEWVRVHSDDDDTLYHAQVTDKLSDRDYRVAIKFDSRVPVLNKAWSASAGHPALTGDTPTAATAPRA